jgi:hypothetical protein
MLRISKNTNKIVSIHISTKEEVPENYTPTEIDSFVIIPGVTNYNHIYSKENWLVFDGNGSYIYVNFLSEGDLERFFIQLMRDIKLNQITNVSVEAKDSK